MSNIFKILSVLAISVSLVSTSFAQSSQSQVPAECKSNYFRSGSNYLKKVYRYIAKTEGNIRKAIGKRTRMTQRYNAKMELIRGRIFSGRINAIQGAFKLAELEDQEDAEYSYWSGIIEALEIELADVKAELLEVACIIRNQRSFCQGLGINVTVILPSIVNDQSLVCQ